VLELNFGRFSCVELPDFKANSAWMSHDLRRPSIICALESARGSLTVVWYDRYIQYKLVLN
jgi:hypothetical protein